MFRQSPNNRNQRSKGFRVKHALQIFVLLAVSIWLLYQLKHSHDKKKAFDESNVRLSQKVEGESEHEILKLGRKDLLPQVEETTDENGTQSGEEEDEEKMHEEEDQEKTHEEEENKTEEGEGESRSRGGGDDEIDNQDQEKAEEGVDRGDEFVEKEESEEKASEQEESEERARERERESEEQEEKIENVGSSEDQDHDGGDKNIQEAREEHYKGDDASSAVARDSQVMTNEGENGASGNSNEEEQVERLENNDLDLENKTNGTEEVTYNDHNADLNADSGESIESNPSVNGTVSEEKVTETNLYKSENGSHQAEVNDNSIAENGTDNGSSSLTHDQNSTLETETSNGGDSNTTAGVEQSEANSTLSSTTENDEAKNEPKDSSSNSEAVVVPVEKKSNTTDGVEDSDGSSFTNEKNDAAQADKAETTVKDGVEDSLVSSTTNENAEAAQVESVDSSLPQEVKDVRTDLGTLPDIETMGRNNEEVAAE